MNISIICVAQAETAYTILQLLLNLTFMSRKDRGFYESPLFLRCWSGPRVQSLLPTRDVCRQKGNIYKYRTR